MSELSASFGKRVLLVAICFVVLLLCFPVHVTTIVSATFAGQAFGLKLPLPYYWVIVPVIAFTIELIIVLVLFFGGIAGRVLFRRPWTVRARSAHQTHRFEQVGFRRSGRLRDEVADALASGRALP